MELLFIAEMLIGVIYKRADMVIYGAARRCCYGQR